MAQGRSWLAETAKICRSGPSVAMVTELMLPSGSVRAFHTEPPSLGQEPRSLWTPARPHSFFPSSIHNATLIFQAKIHNQFKHTTKFASDKGNLGCKLDLFQVNDISSSFWASPHVAKLQGGGCHLYCAVLQGTPCTRIFSGSCPQRLYWGTLLLLS